MKRSSARSVDRILLIGMMGVGKSTVGRLLARHLGWVYVDSDERVSVATGKTVREIFEHDGEAAFRAEESKALTSALAEPRPAVVSVAGGAVLDPENRRRIVSAEGLVVWLRAPVDVLVARVAAGRDHRPLLDSEPRAALQRLASEREPLYRTLADLVVDVDGKTPEEIVVEIAEVL